MNSNLKTLCLAMALGLISASAFAVSPYGNASHKGSLLIFPLIDITDGRDTLIRITNDFSGFVTLKCYYQATDSRDYRVKYRNDFTIDITKTQPAHWWARTGRSTGNARLGFIVRPFGTLTQAGPAGVNGTVDTKKIERGELKCWAMSEDLQTPIMHNHLTGTATIFDSWSGHAIEYNSWAFQALPLNGAPGTPVGTVNPADRSAKLVLNGLPGNYDLVPKTAIGNFTPVGNALDGIGTHWTKLYLSGVRQDLRQGQPAVVTKYAFTFWNQDESQYTGEHVCGDSWIDKWLGDFYSATDSALKTDSAYYRVESIGDKYVCGDDAEAVGMVGVQVHGVARLGPPVEGSTTPVSEDILVHAAPTHGRGSIAGEIAFDLDADPAEVKR